jgi:transcription antitermination factor NusG
MFLRFDIERDRWQQVLRAPGVIEFLGDPTPVPESVYMDLITRCTAILSLREQAEALVPVGSTVEILEGPLARRQGVVSRSSGDMVEIEMVVFNRITRVVMAPRQVMIVG